MSEPIFFCAATPAGNFSPTGYFKGAARFLSDCPHRHKTREAAARCAKRNGIPGTIATTRSGRTVIVDHATYEPIDGDKAVSDIIYVRRVGGRVYASNESFVEWREWPGCEDYEIPVSELTLDKWKVEG